ncbi:MAG: hypothetical protein HN884_02180, partial [Rhodospirillaceae bacterium]|nr:hypothetical protein [Rhodospirillaceae bacterium]
IFVTLLTEAMADFSGIHLIIEGVILILVIRFMPYGLWGVVLKMLRRIPLFGGTRA